MESSYHYATAVFAGNPLGPVPPFAAEAFVDVFLLQSYRFNVTGFVTGNGSYPFTFSTSGGLNYYAALVVVFRHPSESPKRIVINDGSAVVQSGTFTTIFNNMQAGNGTLTIVTQADDSADTNESILFNGT